MSWSLNVSYYNTVIEWLHLQPVKFWLDLETDILCNTTYRRQLRDGPKLIDAAMNLGPFTMDVTQSLRAISEATRCVITCVCHQVKARGQHGMKLAATATAVPDAAEWMVLANTALLLGIAGALPQSEIKKWWDVIFKLPCKEPGIIERLINSAPA